VGGGAIQGWFLIALVCGFAGYALYLMGLRRQLVQPNRASWLIWSAATAAEALTYAAANPGVPQSWIFFGGTAACILTTLAIWRRSNWALPSVHEGFCMAACLSAIILWLVLREALWAHLLVVLAVPVSFWPTWESVWQDPNRERSPAWALWTAGDLATLLVALHASGNGVAEYAYIVVELLCHASVWAMVMLGTANPLRLLSTGNGKRHLERAAASLFHVGDTHLGKAVFAAEGFAEGDTIIRFTGRRLRADKVPSLMRGQADRFVQVTPEHYMGPSGRIDDLINHSCAPNAGLRFTDDGVFLVAIRAIASDEEISWDYSTTLAQSNWHMICQCRSADCRRVIGNFASLPEERQEWFRARNLVAPYLRRRDAVRRDRAA